MTRTALALLALLAASCTPSAQLAQLCSAEGGDCRFLDGLSARGEYSRDTGLILIDRAQCDADWPYCEWVVYHELGHQRGADELGANCYALEKASMPARRAAFARLGSQWTSQCE